MPFKNRVANIGGTVVLPHLRSPDYAATLSPIAITGWELDTNPSQIVVKTVYAEKINVKDYSGGTLDIAAWVRTTDVNKPTKRRCTASLTPASFVAANISGLNFTAELATDGGVGDSGDWSDQSIQITSTLDIQQINAGAGVFVGECVVTELDSQFNTLATTTLAPQILMSSNYVGARNMNSQIWQLYPHGFTASYAFDLAYQATTRYVQIQITGRSSTANQYRVNATHSTVATG